MAIVVCLAGTTFTSDASSADTPTGSDLPRRDAVSEAVRSSLGFLLEEGDQWLEGRVPVQEGRGCVSCHHVGYALWSHSEADRAGVEFRREPVDDLRRRTLDFLAKPDKLRVATATQLIMAGQMRDAGVALLGGADGKPDGAWRARGQFPSQRRSEEESDGVVSLWALAALATVEPVDARMERRLERAFAWLETVEDGVSNEWTVARAVVEQRFGDRERTERLCDVLLSSQGADGGWGWFEQDPSNPYSTGQTVYGLATIGDPRFATAIRRGVDYLLEHQRPEGFWLTPSRYTSRTESEARDIIYRYWGTAWASIGLSRALQCLAATECLPGTGRDEIMPTEGWYPEEDP
jgi:hypothetical protein